MRCPAVSTLLLLCACDPVFTGETSAFLLESRTIGDTFLISVHTPAGYSGNRERYPVAYVLDGTVHSGPAAAIAEDEGVEVVVVGVGYQDGVSTARRRRDYTPTPDPAFPTSGGAGPFLSFIRDELVPRIDHDLRTRPGERALLGHSLGGIAALYFAFNQDPATPLFPTIVSASPSVWWDDGVFFDYEAELSRRTSDLELRLMATAGGLEYAVINALLRELVRRLASRGYSGLTLEHREHDDETHTLSWQPAYREGLRFAFGR
jgi:predicted alpha/beta superfamily hydrolase